MPKDDMIFLNMKFTAMVDAVNVYHTATAEYLGGNVNSQDDLALFVHIILCQSFMQQLELPLQDSPPIH